MMMKNKKLYRIWFVLILLCSCAVKPTLEAGRALHQKNNYKKALKTLQAYLLSKPSDREKVAEAHYLVAETYVQLSKKDKAEVEYLKIVEDFPGTKFARKSVLSGIDKVYGQSMIAEGKYRLVQRKFNSGIKLLRLFVVGAPDYELAPGALFFVAEGYDMKGDQDMARKVYQEVVDKYPETPYAGLCLRLLGHYLRNEGKYAEAEKMFLASQKHNPMNSNIEDCHLDLAELYHYKTKDYGKALIEYAKLHKKTQNPRIAPKSYYGSSSIYMEQNQNNKAIPLLKKILKDYDWCNEAKKAKVDLEKIKSNP
jgi:TolA-binding protein